MAAATAVPHSLADMVRLTPAAVTPAAATVVVAGCNPPTEGQSRGGRTGRGQGQEATNLPLKHASPVHKRKRVQFKSDITGLDSIDEPFAEHS
jgi:hypothetical protein